MKKTILGFFFALLVCAHSGAQEVNPAGVPQPAVLGAEDRLRLASSSGTYPATPGDVYTLTFQQGGVLSTLQLLVGSDYTIQLNVFGRVNVEGMVFPQVKQNIEKAFVAAYPRSIPSLSITSVGVFQVLLKGELPRAQIVNAWGLSRLSDILEGRLGPFSSLRNIKVISKNGEERQFDLFKYQRLGDVDQDPYMKPNDTVVIAASERTVDIAGEVKRPGKYQLLPSDQLMEAIDFCGGGLTAAAETTQVRIDRISGEKAQTFYVSLSDPSGAGSSVQDGDTITVPSKNAELPLVFFEGAITGAAPGAALPQPAAAPPGTAGNLPGATFPQGANAPQAAVAPPAAEAPGLLAPVTYNRLRYSFRQGETIRSALIALRQSISPNADLSGAFLIRDGVTEPIPIDLAALLSGTGTNRDMPLRPLDRIVIPTAQFSVAVYGDVAKPGNYPYTPSKTYRYYADQAGFGDIEEIPQNILILDAQGARHDVREALQPGSRIYLTASRVVVNGAVLNPGAFPYRRDFTVASYLNLAGGFDPEKSSNGRSAVYDSKGKPRKETDSIQPGDRIYVYSDKFEYNFNKGFPVFLSLVTVVATAVTVYALLK